MGSGENKSCSPSYFKFHFCSISQFASDILFPVVRGGEEQWSLNSGEILLMEKFRSWVPLRAGLAGRGGQKSLLLATNMIHQKRIRQKKDLTKRIRQKRLHYKKGSTQKDPIKKGSNKQGSNKRGSAKNESNKKESAKKNSPKKTPLKKNLPKKRLH